MQGLNDLEQLSHIDWRFAVLRKMAGLLVNKEKRGAGTKNSKDDNVHSILIEKRDKVMVGFLGQLLFQLKNSIDLLNIFETGPSMSDQDLIVDTDVLLNSIIQAAILHLNDTLEIKRSVLPQLIAIVYQRMSAGIGKIEVYTGNIIADDEDLMIYEATYEEMDDAEVSLCKFFIEVIFAIQHLGLE